MDPTFRKAERSRLQRERNALQARRRELEAQIAAIDARLAVNEKEVAPYASVYILPDEILAMILKLAYQHQFPRCRLDDGTLKHSPAAISRVSRRWRNVALSEPSLWNCIHVGPNGSKNRYLAEFVKLHLVWSGDLPVNFIFSCHVWNIDWTVFQATAWPYYAKCWKYILTQRHRWKNAVIIVTHNKAMETILNSLKHKSYPKLEYLSTVLRPGTPGAKETRFPFLGDWALKAPLLRRLWVGNNRFWQANDGLKSLSEIKLHDFTVDPIKLFQFLKEHASTLKSLTLGNITVESRYPPPSFPTISFPNLKFLVLETVVEMETEREDFSVAATICRGSPSLETLLLHDNEITPNGLTVLLRSSRIILHSVRHLLLLNDNSFLDSEAELIEPTITPAFVRAFPSLEILEVTFLGTDCMEAAKQVNAEAGCCAAWPALHTLRLIEIDERVFTSFLEYRAKAKFPIHTVAVNDGLRCFSEMFDVFDYLGIKCPEASYPSGAYDFAEFAVPYWDIDKNAPILVPWEDKWDVDDQWIEPDPSIGKLSTGHDYEDEENEGDEYEDESEDEDEQEDAMDEDN